MSFHATAETESFCPAYCRTVRGYDEQQLERITARAAAYRRLRRRRRRKLKSWQFSLARMFVIVTVLCILLAGPWGRALRDSTVIAKVRTTVRLSISPGAVRRVPVVNIYPPHRRAPPVGNRWRQ